MITQIAQQPPNNVDKKLSAGYPDDELPEKLIKLTSKQSKDLLNYLKGKIYE